MGNQSSSEQRTQSTTKQNPWERAIPQLEENMNQLAPLWGNTGITGNESAALANLQGNANAGNPFSGQISQLATDLLGGGPDRTGMVQGAADTFRAGMTPFANASTNPWENADFRNVVDNTTNTVMDRVKSGYQGAGISAANFGDFGQTAGRGITEAIAPLAYQAGNDLTNRKMGAMNSIFGADTTAAGILSGLDQNAFANRQAGIGAANSALTAQDAPFMRTLELEAMRRGIPVQNVAQLENLILPIAQLGGTSNTDSYSKATKTASPMETAQGWANVGKTMFGQGGMFGGGGWGSGWGWMS
jgi:Leucine-rich repeat (LRR) protein